MKDVYALPGGLVNEAMYNYLNTDCDRVQQQRASYPGYYYINPDLLMSRPAPRRTKRLVPDAEKDDRYWEKRKRNNEAARRSRENKRRVELDIRQRVVLIEDENNLLRKELAVLKDKFGLARDQRYLAMNESGDLVGTAVAACYLLPPESMLTAFDEAVMSSHSRTESSSQSNTNSSSGSSSSSGSGSANEMEDQSSPCNGGRDSIGREHSPDNNTSSQEISGSPKSHAPLTKMMSRHRSSELQMPVKKRRYATYEEDETDESAPSNPISQSSSPEQRTSPTSFNHTLNSTHSQMAQWHAGAQHHFASPHAQMQLRLQQQHALIAGQQRTINRDPLQMAKNEAILSPYSHAHASSMHHAASVSAIDTVRNFPGYAFHDQALPATYRAPPPLPEAADLTRANSSHDRLPTVTECQRTMYDPDHGTESRSTRSQSDSISVHSSADGNKNDVALENMSSASQDALKQDNADIRTQLQQLTAEIQRMKCLVIKDGLRQAESLRVTSSPSEKTPTL